MIPTSGHDEVIGASKSTKAGESGDHLKIIGEYAKSPNIQVQRNIYFYSAVTRITKLHGFAKMHGNSPQGLMTAQKIWSQVYDFWFIYWFYEYWIFYLFVSVCL